MRYLVDANVLSEATKPRPVKSVLGWLHENSLEIVVNPVILGEIRAGILATPAGRKRQQLMDWFESGVDHLPVVPLDARSAFVWATLLADLKRTGRTMPVKDSLIAATALQHELTVATRNVSDYCSANVMVVNPFDI